MDFKLTNVQNFYGAKYYSLIKGIKNSEGKKKVILFGITKK